MIWGMVTSPDSPTAPRGRDAVRAAVIAAAEVLFAERGYAGVSVRDLAAAAGVNHGLIHRHFGSKDGVLHAVLQGMFSEVGALARGGLDVADDDFVVRMFPLAAARKRHWQILMRAVMDGFDFQGAGFEFPITQTIVDHVAAVRGDEGPDARTIAGFVIASGLGWLLLETYLTPILHLESQTPETLRNRISAMAQWAGRNLPSSTP